jgi:hypothetical protein
MSETPARVSSATGSLSWGATDARHGENPRLKIRVRHNREVAAEIVLPKGGERVHPRENEGYWERRPQGNFSKSGTA